MKKLLFALAALLCFVGCEYDDSEIKNSIAQLEQRLSAVEAVQNAYKNNLFIKSVVQTTNGYTITFSDGSTATITNGKDGADGKDGKDGDTLIESITISESEVTFVLTDGRRFSIPLYNALSVTFDVDDTVVVAPNSTLTVGYSVESNIKDVVVEVTSSADIKARVVKEGDLTGKIEIKTGETIDEYSKVIVFVSNGEKVIMRSITFEQEGLQIVDNVTKNASAEGGEVVLEYLTNVECEVVIPEDAQSWISVVPATRALERQTITLKLDPNEGYYRSATVTIQSSDGSLKLEYQVEQDGDLGVEINPEDVPDNEIWYRTTDNQKYDIYHCTNLYGHQPFDAQIISHTYENGIGKIICDNIITKINDSAFGNGWRHKLSELYLPETIEIIEGGGIRGNSYLTTLRIPKNLKSVGSYGLNNPNLKSFTGSHITEDGRCVIIEDGFMPNFGNKITPVKNYIAAFAPAGITEYTLPSNVEILGWYAFAWCSELRKITFNEGLKTIMGDCFYESHLDCEIILPSTLENLDTYAFHSCSGIKGFYGNEYFHTSDNKCLLSYANLSHPGPWLVNFAGAGITDYIIPDRIKAIENQAFNGLVDLQSITIPASVEIVSYAAFYNCSNLQYVYGPNITDHRAFVRNNEFVVLIARKNLPTTYHIPDNITKIGYSSFYNCKEIENITMGDQVTHIDGSAFSYMPNLKSVTLSASLKQIGYPTERGFVSNSCNIFIGSNSLETIYFRSIVPPSFLYKQNIESLNQEYPNLTVYVPQGTLNAYKNSDWYPFAKYMVEYQYTDLPFQYISSDYSQDGKVTTLQTATKGNGIDIVLMGDGYSDRQIADGTYERVMKLAYEKLFTEEPYKSHKELFNVYYVTAVSATEGYEHGNTAFGGWFGEGTAVGGSDNVAMNYATNAIEESQLNNAMIVVMMNSDRYAGTCYMYYPDGANDYGSGLSVSYFPVGTSAEQLEQLLHHETCGHGFTKLADEYAYDYMGTVPADQVAATQSQWAWGWWKNVDFTSDTSKVLWSKFIADERYKYDGLGAFEGGMTYWTGVWRPTENSIMRYNTGGFNAPSREAIYYRIHKLAYGDSWQYDYEKFVEYDAINRKTGAEQTATHTMVLRPMEPTTPPVVVPKTWREALGK